MINIRRLRHIDYILLSAVAVLLVCGWFMMYSASYYRYLMTGINYPQKQFMWIIAAVAVFFIMLSIDYHRLLNMSFLIYGVVAILLVSVFLFGERRFGARRWLSIAGFSVQPSEFAKMGIILAAARYLVLDIARRKELRYIILCCIIVFSPLLLVLKQPDLGTVLLFIPTTAVMLFAAGARGIYLAGMCAAAVSSVPFLWGILKTYQKDRILSFLDPGRDPFGAGYSIIQSKIAIGSGGLLGKGWLSGTQNRLNFVPERHTDFIFSVAGEEFGFVGALIILLLFFLIIAAGFNIARKAPDASGRILALGIITLFSVQVGVNIGMTMGLLPVTGLTLPFTSYGGTSLVVSMAMAGILENIYMNRFMF